MTKEEAKAITEGLDEEGLRMLYGFLLALHGRDMETVAAMEAAGAAGDIERVKNLSEQAIAQA